MVRLSPNRSEILNDLPAVGGADLGIRNLPPEGDSDLASARSVQPFKSLMIVSRWFPGLLIILSIARLLELLKAISHSP